MSGEREGRLRASKLRLMVFTRCIALATHPLVPTEAVSLSMMISLRTQTLITLMARNVANEVGHTEEN